MAATTAGYYDGTIMQLTAAPTKIMWNYLCTSIMLVNDDTDDLYFAYSPTQLAGKLKPGERYSTERILDTIYLWSPKLGLQYRLFIN